MSVFLRLFGLTCILIVIAMVFLGQDVFMLVPFEYRPNDYHLYVQALQNNKLLVIGLGVFLITVGNITKTEKQTKVKVISKENDYSKLSLKVKHKNVHGELLASGKIQKVIDSQDGKLKQLAKEVEWTPLTGGGSSFNDSYLKKVSSYRYEVSSSTFGMIFAGLFVGVGLLVFGIGLKDLSKMEEFEFSVLFLSLFGLTLICVGAAMLYWPRPRIFDITRGWFWVGSKSLLREQDYLNVEQSSRLPKISAIQLISKSVSDADSSNSWEINIVLEDSARLNVMGHGDVNSIRSDAKLLGEFLNVPVWDIS